MSSGSLKYLVGDATRPSIKGNKIIIHCCNNKRKWGKGFVLALSKRWKNTRDVYMKSSMELGAVSYAKVNDNTWVANIIGQNGYGYNKCFVNYDALEIGLEKVAKLAKEINASIHGPKLGSGLAGGDWNTIEKILYNVFNKNNIDVYIYTLS